VDNKPKRQAASEGKIFCEYWTAYGGWWSLLKSRYFVASCVCTILIGKWAIAAEWWETALSVIPSILGFSLGGYAMLFAFGSESFQHLMAKAKTEGHSVMVVTSATFVHFILVQCLTIIVALFAKANCSICKPNIIGLVFACTGSFLMCYSIALAVAATMRIFRLSRMLALQLEIEARRAQNEIPPACSGPAQPQSSKDNDGAPSA